ncbi:hypothetical protein CPLU01_07667 [Colletotrichum plurivorum]|uniref:Uncharacterized protein n=1 Tax=Colletotrichum plurivorum TaxID=2175906 RepID=A0A8H6KE42_9PEZI|nr:hypothetical protein CPLU01_07667 [Colletotrichum plurivorum]
MWSLDKVNKLRVALPQKLRYEPSKKVFRGALPVGSWRWTADGLKLELLPSCGRPDPRYPAEEALPYLKRVYTGTIDIDLRRLRLWIATLDTSEGSWGLADAHPSPANPLDIGLRLPLSNELAPENQMPGYISC